VSKGNKIHKKLCIIILNYNNELDTIACVTSVYDSENIELPFIIIVDNSNKKSQFNDRLEFYPVLKILAPEKNLGFAEGNNYGIRWALDNMIFDFLFILNNDTLLKKDTLFKMLSYAFENPQVTVFTPCIVTAETPPRIWYAGGELNHCRITPRVNHIEEIFNDSVLTDSKTEFASGCAFMVSQAMYDFREALFDPYFFIYDEDVEFSLRLSKSGRIIDFISEAIVIHKCQGSQQKGPSKKINQLSPGNVNLLFYLRNTIRNRFYIIDKHFLGTGRISRKICIVSYWLLKSIQYAMHFRFKAAFVVIFEILSYNLGKK
jgi:GT2 family glycosyltransferase